MRPTSRLADPFLLALLGVSLAGNVYLYRNRWERPPDAVRSLHAGDTVPALSALTPDGKTLTLTYDRHPAVLYVFSPSCVWCERNLDNAEAVRTGTGDKFEFVAIAFDDKGLGDYIQKRHLPWTIATGLSPEVRAAYGISATPETIVVDVGGRVHSAWIGAYGDSVAREVQGVLGVTLPGLRPAGSTPVPRLP